MRRAIILLIMLFLAAVPLASVELTSTNTDKSQTEQSKSVVTELDGLAVKGRAPKTGYSRSQFGNGWDTSLGCDTRNRILRRDMTDVVLSSDNCKVVSGTLNDPYTGNIIHFTRGASTSDEVQIDHVVALSNAWQTGAQQLTYDQRVALANDPLNLLSVDGPTNEEKSDGDIATWQPPNKPFRCQYAKRQIEVKVKYGLWLTPAEHDTLQQIVTSRC